MLSATDKKIARILAVSTAEAAATAVGVSPSYVSQLSSNKEFQELVAACKIAATDAQSEREQHNALLDQMEYSVARSLKASLDAQVMYDPAKLLGLLIQFNKLQRRAASTDSPQTSQTHTTVTIEVNQVLAAKLSLNSENEVMAVGDMQLTTIQPDILSKDVYGQPIAALRSTSGNKSPKALTLNPDGSISL